MKRCVWSLCLPLVFGCGDSESNEPGNGGDHGGTVLEELGVSTDVGARLNPVGEALPEDYNPTGRPQTQLQKRSEIFFAGTRGQGGDTGLTPNPTQHAGLDWPDETVAFIPGRLTVDDQWLQMPKAMTAGDVDGDGIDEIVIAYVGQSTEIGQDKDLALKVLEFEDGRYVVTFSRIIASYTNSAITEYPSEDYWARNFSATTGDADGNGARETLIAFNGSIFLLGDEGKDFGLLKAETYPKSADTKYKLLRIAAGDLTNDGADDFVVVESSLQSNVLLGSAAYHIYSGILLNEIDSEQLSVTKGAQTVTLRSANVAVGDLDADGLREVLFVGLQENSDTIYFFVLDTLWDDSAKKFVNVLDDDFATVTGRGSTNFTPMTFIADFDGDGKKEMLVQRRIYENLAETGGSFVQKPVDVYDATNAGPLGAAWDTIATVGDVDGDMRDDVVFVSDGYWEIFWLGYNQSGQWVLKKNVNIFDSGAYYPAVAAGDFDGDSIVVRFVESETLFSNPHPIALLASNPRWEGIDMEGGTSFGTKLGEEVEREKSVGLSVGFSVGYESEGLFGLWSASFKVSMESSFDWTATQSRSIEQSYTYSTSGEDKVIFTAIPYDVYYYDIIVSPDPDMVGTAITVNLPRKPVTLPVERTYYNAHNGGAPDIDAAVLTHTVGDPLSYPTREEAAALVALGGGEGIMSNDVLTVGQGTGTTAIELSVTQGTGHGTAFDFSVTIESEVGAGGFTAGVSAGFHYGESYSITTTNGTVYGGEIGNIPADAWSLDRSFSWGLFSYRTTVGAEKMIIVQYFTELI